MQRTETELSIELPFYLINMSVFTLSVYFLKIDLKERTPKKFTWPREQKNYYRSIIGKSKIKNLNVHQKNDYTIWVESYNKI